MKRREFITLAGGAAVVWPLAAGAQQPVMRVVGFVVSGLLPERDATLRVAAFHQGMKESGFVDGKNVAIEHRPAERLPSQVADLLRRQVALIVGNTPASLAAKAATTTVPIIFVTGGDPVKDGLVT